MTQPPYPPGWPPPPPGRPPGREWLVAAVIVGAVLIVAGFYILGAVGGDHAACSSASVQFFATQACSRDNALFYGAVAAIVIGVLAAVGGILGLVFGCRR